MVLKRAKHGINSGNSFGMYMFSKHLRRGILRPCKFAVSYEVPKRLLAKCPATHLLDACRKQVADVMSVVGHDADNLAAQLGAFEPRTQITRLTSPLLSMDKKRRWELSAKLFDAIDSNVFAPKHDRLGLGCSVSAVTFAAIQYRWFAYSSPPSATAYGNSDAPRRVIYASESKSGKTKTVSNRCFTDYRDMIENAFRGGNNRKNRKTRTKAAHNRHFRGIQRPANCRHSKGKLAPQTQTAAVQSGSSCSSTEDSTDTIRLSGSKSKFASSLATKRAALHFSFVEARKLTTEHWYQEAYSDFCLDDVESRSRRRLQSVLDAAKDSDFHFSNPSSTDDFDADDDDEIKVDSCIAFSMPVPVDKAPVRREYFLSDFVVANKPKRSKRKPNNKKVDAEADAELERPADVLMLNASNTITPEPAADKTGADVGDAIHVGVVLYCDEVYRSERTRLRFDGAEMTPSYLFDTFGSRYSESETWPRVVMLDLTEDSFGVGVGVGVDASLLLHVDDPIEVDTGFGSGGYGKRDNDNNDDDDWQVVKLDASGSFDLQRQLSNRSDDVDDKRPGVNRRHVFARARLLIDGGEESVKAAQAAFERLLQTAIVTVTTTTTMCGAAEADCRRVDSLREFYSAVRSLVSLGKSACSDTPTLATHTPTLRAGSVQVVAAHLRQVETHLRKYRPASDAFTTNTTPTAAGLASSTDDDSTDWVLFGAQPPTPTPKIFECCVCLGRYDCVGVGAHTHAYMHEVDRHRSRVRLERCGHQFCTLCFSLYVIKATATSCRPVECAAHKCRTSLDAATVCSVVAGVTYFRYLRRVRDAELRRSRQFVRCRNPRCGALMRRLHADASTPKTRRKRANCVRCLTPVCVECGAEPHCPATCDEASRFTESIESSTDRKWYVEPFGGLKPILTKSEEHVKVLVKRCPTCREFIENVGCYNVKCVCGTNFCWSCLKLWSTHRDAIYSASSCENFTRARVVILNDSENYLKTPRLDDFWQLAAAYRAARLAHRTRTRKLHDLQAYFDVHNQFFEQDLARIVLVALADATETAAEALRFAQYFYAALHSAVGNAKKAKRVAKTLKAPIDALRFGADLVNKTASSLVDLDGLKAECGSDAGRSCRNALVRIGAASKGREDRLAKLQEVTRACRQQLEKCTATVGHSLCFENENRF